jgi:hypothetical protein
VAILIDRRAQLFDSLSTAWIFELGKGTAVAPAEVVAGQRSQAEALARDVDLETALPFTVPRATYAMAALFLVATSLFALRYGITHSLDLKPPLPAVVMDALGWTPPAAAEKAKHPAENRMTALLKQLGISVPEPGEKIQASNNLDPATDAALETINDPDADNSMAKNPPGAKAEDASMQGKAGDPSTDPEDASSNDESAPGKGNPEDSSGSQEGPQQGEQQASKGSAGENSSLLSKIKDAINNMMSKSKSQQASGGQKSQSQSSQAQNGPQTAEKGQPGQGKQDGGKDNADPSQDGQQGDSEAAQNSPGKGGGKSNDRDASAQPGSGIGRQDGAKDLHAAQQEKAMGKLSEVIGKRSANVTGEMTVEVQSGSQQLRTSYSQRNAQHTANSGDLNRDEVPLDLQPYVSGYFDEIRKQPAKSAK